MELERYRGCPRIWLDCITQYSVVTHHPHPWTKSFQECLSHDLRHNFNRLCVAGHRSNEALGPTRSAASRRHASEAAYT